MASALSSQSVAATSLLQRVSLTRVLPRNVAAVPRRCRLSVSASLEAEVQKVDELLKQEDNQTALAGGMASSFFSLLALAPSASAAQEVMSMAASDNRGLVLLGILGPALGWVLFNILKPALNQWSNMAAAGPSKSSKTRRFGMIAGLSASAAAAGLLASPPAEAAELFAELAVDNRPLVLGGLLVAVLGWVLFNIALPGFNQLSRMQQAASKRAPPPKARKARGLVGAVGLSAAGLLASDSADAAQEIMTLADDQRPFILGGILVAAIGWVLFNITRPALGQVSKMVSAANARAPPPKARRAKALIGATGLSAAALLSSDSADAAQEVMNLAVDNRPFILLGLLVAVLGWVLFNIARPALNQVFRMVDQASKRSPAPKKPVKGRK
jgi:photosystem II PsbY protein